MNRENKTIIKALNIYGRVPEQWELLEEIERLNNKINRVIDYLEKNTYDKNGECGYTYDWELYNILKGNGKE